MKGADVIRNVRLQAKHTRVEKEGKDKQTYDGRTVRRRYLK